MLSVPAFTGAAISPLETTTPPIQRVSGHWIGVWGASPRPWVPFRPNLDNQTIRQLVRINGGGSQIRLRLSNEYGSKPLVIGEVHVALPAGFGGMVMPGSDHVVTFSSSKSVSIPAGSSVFSDPIAMDVKPLTSFAVSIYLPVDTGLCTCHLLALQTGYVTGHGNFTGTPILIGARSFLLRAFLTEVDAQAEAKAVVTFGDSLTDGYGSMPDRNHRWPDRLAERLSVRAHGKWGVVNAGIAGNQLLTDGDGEAAVVRFGRDVLGVPGVSHVIVLLGINDLGHGYGPPPPDASAAVKPPTYDDMLAGYRQLIVQAHAHGVKIYAATLTPFKGAVYWSPAGEALRQRINRWIRTSPEWDGFVDFDATWRDPAQPAQIRDGLGAPDQLHGSDAGYVALADAVPLSIFN